MKIILGLITLSLLVLLESCQSEIDFVEINNININTNNADIVMDDNGLGTFEFDASGQWAVAVADTSLVQWLSIDKYAGTAGKHNLQIVAMPNYNHHERKAYLTLTSGNAGITIGVLQGMGNAVADIPIQDQIFKEYCLANFDTNKDGQLSYVEARDVKVIDLSAYNKVKTVQGIEYFKNLEQLICSNNLISNIDVGKNLNLKKLMCNGNLLTSIDLSRNSELTELSIYNNRLTEIDITNNAKLKSLDCSYNKLTSLLPNLNNKLRYLNCGNNSIAKLDLTHNPNLENLYCQDNVLTLLTLNRNFTLSQLWCYNNQLTLLDVSNFTSLIDLECYNNQLTKLVLVNTPALDQIDCSNNRLTAIDVSANNVLSIIYCSDNLLSMLDLSSTQKLIIFKTDNNPNLKSIQINRVAFILSYTKDNHTEVLYK